MSVCERVQNLYFLVNFLWLKLPLHSGLMGRLMEYMRSEARKCWLWPWCYGVSLLQCVSSWRYYRDCNISVLWSLLAIGATKFAGYILVNLLHVGALDFVCYYIGATKFACHSEPATC